jgi:lipopolysaccharide transport system ATP-binding protein
MPSRAVSTTALGKRYRIREGERPDTLRDLAAHAAARLRGNVDRAHGASAWRDVWALRDVTFEIPAGEICGIIGPNGAGKSTLLKILSRITSPTEGNAVVRGRVGSLLEVGVGFHPELTGRENVTLSGAVLGMSRNEVASKMDAMVEFADIGQYLDTPVKRYSSGMYMRLAFSVAAHLDPEVLIIDEVLAVGDYRFQRKCLQRIRQAQTTGDTIIIVSHNLSTIRSLCDRVLWMEGGRVVMDASAEDCVDAYVRANRRALSGVAVDVSRVTRPLGQGETFRFVAVHLHTANNAGVLPTGAPLRVDLSFKTTAPVDSLVLGMSVRTAEGIRILDVVNTAYGPPCPVPSAGLYTVAVECENPLAPGDYVVGVGARSPEGALDWVEEAFTFEVVEKRARDEWLVPLHGLVRTKASFGEPILVDSASSYSVTDKMSFTQA